jgi:CAAX prenyl protease-like protein
MIGFSNLMEPSPDTADPVATPTPGNAPFGARPWFPYVLPMAAYLLLTAAEPYIPRSLYSIAYMGKAVILGIVLAVTAKSWRGEIGWEGKAVGLGILAGLIGLPLWLGVDAITPHFDFLGKRVGYNPFEAITDPGLRMAFLAVRFCGLAALVPIMEEVFWRSFLLRWVTDQDRWQTLPVGTFSVAALAIVSALFGAAHPEYLAGIVFALLMAGLLRLTRSLLACIVAHGVTNLALGIYVLVQHDWKYW